MCSDKDIARVFGLPSRKVTAGAIGDVPESVEQSVYEPVLVYDQELFWLGSPAEAFMPSVSLSWPSPLLQQARSPVTTPLALPSPLEHCEALSSGESPCQASGRFGYSSPDHSTEDAGQSKGSSRRHEDQFSK